MLSHVYENLGFVLVGHEKTNLDLDSKCRVPKRDLGFESLTLRQKKFTVDFLQKKLKVNEGEAPQYYVENSHEAIIDPLLFERVQEEMARRKALGRSYSGKTIFSCRLICGDCGHYLGSKVWNSTDKYRRVIWQCNNKFKGECKCGTPHLTEDFIKAKFLEAYKCFYSPTGTEGAPKKPDRAF